MARLYHTYIQKFAIVNILSRIYTMRDIFQVCIKSRKSIFFRNLIKIYQYIVCKIYYV